MVIAVRLPLGSTAPLSHSGKTNLLASWHKTWTFFHPLALILALATSKRGSHRSMMYIASK